MITWEEPILRLDIRCGLNEISDRDTTCYHVNFLAYHDDGACNAITPSRVLFFAKVWESRLWALFLRLLWDKNRT